MLLRSFEALIDDFEVGETYSPELADGIVVAVELFGFEFVELFGDVVLFADTPKSCCVASA